MIKIPLGGFLAAAASPLAKRVIASLGMGIISFTGISIALTAAINHAQTAFSGLPTYIFALAGIGGIGQGLGMIAGALVFRAAYAAMPKLGAIPS